MAEPIMINGKPYEPDPNRVGSLRRIKDEGPSYETWIYFIQCKETKRVKIGIANNPSNRFDQIQTSCHTDLRWLGLMWRPRYMEKRLHRAFAKFHARGEWFEGAPEVVEYVFFNAKMTQEKRQLLWHMHVFKGSPMGADMISDETIKAAMA